MGAEKPSSMIVAVAVDPIAYLKYLLSPILPTLTSSIGADVNYLSTPDMTNHV